MIRILHIVPSTSHTSGIMTVLMNYYRKIDRTKFQFDFLSYKKPTNGHDEEIKALGGRCFIISDPRDVLSFKKDVNNFCKEHYNEYSIIHLHMTFLYFAYKGMKKKLNAKAFVIHAHNTKFGNTKLTNIRNTIIFRLNPCNADAYFACSKDAGTILFKKKYIDSGYFMYNIVDTNIYNKNYDKQEAKKELNLENNIVIGDASNFTFQKNHLFIVDVFNEFLKIHPDARLLLVGNGMMFNKTQEKAKMLGIFDKTIFMGDRTDVERYYHAMDLFIQPSIFEGFCLSFVEAQACLIPCVISDALPEEANINKEHNKVISLEKNPEYWAKEIDELINREKNCESKYLDMNKHFNECVKDLENKYRSLIENK